MQRYAESFEAFYAALQEHPYLGATHALGRKIHGAIQKFPQTTIRNETWFRARQVEDGKEKRPEEFFAPDPDQHRIGEGRFNSNHHGQSVLFLANTCEGAVREVTGPGETMAWVQKLKIKGIAKILDLTATGPSTTAALPVIAAGVMHSGALEQHARRHWGWLPEYFIPWYVADCARSAQFHGIKFTASRHSAENLVLFKPQKTELTPIGQPGIVRLKHPALEAGEDF